MDGFRVLRNTRVVILGVCIAAATIVASVILSQGFIKVIKMTREQITVTGSANKQITSDYVVWRAGSQRQETIGESRPNSQFDRLRRFRARLQFVIEHDDRHLVRFM